jgi:hypothetical protein
MADMVYMNNVAGVLHAKQASEKPKNVITECYKWHTTV